MSSKFFGFRSNPFSSTTNARFLYFTTAYQRAYAAILAGVYRHRGLMVVTGVAGSGKTTLMNRLVAELGADTRLVKLSGGDFIDGAVRGGARSSRKGASHGLNKPQDRSKLAVIGDFLKVEAENGNNTALLFDDAHSLDIKILGEILPLLEFRAKADMGIPIVLFGRPALLEGLGKLRQFHGKIDVELDLPKLSEDEVRVYIDTRLRAVDYHGDELFSPEAVEKLAFYANGRPRHINMVCEMVLLHAHLDGSRFVTAELVDKAARTGLQNAVPASPGSEAQSAPVEGTPDAATSTQIFEVASADLQFDALMKQGIEPDDEIDDELDDEEGAMPAEPEPLVALEDEPTAVALPRPEVFTDDVSGDEPPAGLLETVRIIPPGKDTGEQGSTAVQDSGNGHDASALIEPAGEEETAIAESFNDGRFSDEELSDEEPNHDDRDNAQQPSPAEATEVGGDPAPGNGAPANPADLDIEEVIEIGPVRESIFSGQYETTASPTESVPPPGARGFSRYDNGTTLAKPARSMLPMSIVASLVVLLFVGGGMFLLHEQITAPWLTGDDGTSEALEPDLNPTDVEELSVEESAADGEQEFEPLVETVSTSEVAPAEKIPDLQLPATDIPEPETTQAVTFEEPDAEWGPILEQPAETVLSSIELESVGRQPIELEPIELEIVLPDPPPEVEVAPVEVASGADQQVEDTDAPVEGADQQVEGADQQVEGADQQVEGADQQVEGADAEYIAALLSDAARQFVEHKLTTPVDDNAFATYQYVLELAPDNEEALTGIANIKRRYLGWAEIAIAKGDRSRAGRYYRRALVVDPLDLTLEATIAQVSALESSGDLQAADDDSPAQAADDNAQQVPEVPVRSDDEVIRVDDGAKADGGGGNERYAAGFVAAASEDDVDALRTLLTLGAGVNARGPNGKTALMAAIEQGQLDAVHFLLERGAGVNLQSNNGWTALMYAARSGRVSMLRVLIGRNANLELRNRVGSSALDIGVREGNAEVVQVLRQAAGNQVSSS